MVRRLQEISWKVGLSLFMCSVDLQKAYDTVERTLLWQVLPHIGVPSQMIAAIRQFHDGVGARVRPGDSVFSNMVRGGAGTTARIRAILDTGRNNQRR